MVLDWNNHAISLTGTAVTLGVVHVLTGPDHLSAIATLSANVGNSNGLAFWLGVRWGIGHSTGLIAVATVFILVSVSSGDDESIHVPEKFSNVFESLVGVFMLFLGAYGVKRAWRKRPKVWSSPLSSLTSSVGQSHAPTDATASEIFQDPMSSVHLDPSEHVVVVVVGSDADARQRSNASSLQGSEMVRIASYRQREENSQLGHVLEPWNDDDGDLLDNVVDLDNERVASVVVGGGVGVGVARREGWFDRAVGNLSLRTLALGAGIVHGLAGPGGVLGVIPAVQLHSAKWATLYLSSFCLSSTLTMGLFSALYGSCSKRLARGNIREPEQTTEAAAAAAAAATSIHDSEVIPTQTLMSEGPRPSYRDFWIECLSACLSILVGITWLVLLSIGKLDDVFG